MEELKKLLENSKNEFLADHKRYIDSNKCTDEKLVSPDDYIDELSNWDTFEEDGTSAFHDLGFISGLKWAIRIMEKSK